MADKKFIWLLCSGEARNGQKLIQGKEHDVSAFNEAVVAEWVKAGAAKMKKAGKEE